MWIETPLIAKAFSKPLILGVPFLSPKIF